MIAFCTTCKGRTQHLAETLPKNLIDNADDPNHKFIVLDYASPDNLTEYIQANHRQDIDSRRLVVYSFRGQGPFRMAHAKNMCHRLGMMEGADVLVNLDADNFTGVGFAAYVNDLFEAAKLRQEEIFLWAKMVKGDYARGISGRIAVSSQAFLMAGGYDEKYVTWSPDDKDFNARLRRLGISAHMIDKKYLNAVSHNDRMRFREYKHVQAEIPNVSNEEEFNITKDSVSTIANFGRIGHGLVYRNFSTTPISIGPVPTRIFGIGMHKTATTSLHHAMKILGFSSAHWKSAHWAKAIWEEMTTFGKSRTVERNYALCDLPMSLLYQLLDIAYPGSKFILTVRNEDAWLKSVRNHWDYNLNQFRKAWDTDPFTHRVHRELYGRKSFDADVFLARYRRHNAEVRDYFLHRPSDLFVVDMDSPSWNGLCSFLHQPVPSIPYPREYTTPKQEI
jgi:glycosyltransferase involved in cell wall biosynthesis